MVPDTAEQAKGEDYQGCDAAGSGQEDANVQLLRVQGYVGIPDILHFPTLYKIFAKQARPCSQAERAWSTKQAQTNAPDTKVIYRRYASLFFICAISPGDNELITLETIHRYVEVLDRYFGNVSLWTVKCCGDGASTCRQ